MEQLHEDEAFNTLEVLLEAQFMDVTSDTKQQKITVKQDDAVAEINAKAYVSNIPSIYYRVIYMSSQTVDSENEKLRQRVQHIVERAKMTATPLATMIEDMVR